MKKDQEASQQQKSDAAHVSNHVGNPPSHVIENHVPAHVSGSKSLLAKVGLSGGGTSESDNRSSVVASALALAAVDSAVIGGGEAAMAVRGGGADTMTRTERTALGSQPPAAVNERAPAGPTKLPASMTSPPTTTTKKKDAGGGGRRGGGSSNTPRFSQLLDPAVIDDHFDQYLTGIQPPTAATPRRPPARQGDDFPTFSYDNRPSATNEPAPDSRSRAIQRRKTLPGRPPGPLLVGGGGSSNPGHRAAAPTLSGNRENEAISFVAAAAAATATAASAVPVYRKPAAAPTEAAPRAPTTRAGGGGSSGPRLRKANASGNRGSMPDVSECASAMATAASPSMAREEVHVLSQLRREELRRLREEAARRHQQDIVLRLGDIKVSLIRRLPLGVIRKPDSLPPPRRLCFRLCLSVCLLTGLLKN